MYLHSLKMMTMIIALVQLATLGDTVKDEHSSYTIYYTFVAQTLLFTNVLSRMWTMFVTSSHFRLQTGWDWWPSRPGVTVSTIVTGALQPHQHRGKVGEQEEVTLPKITRMIMMMTLLRNMESVMIMKVCVSVISVPWFKTTAMSSLIFPKKMINSKQSWKATKIYVANR